MIKIKKAPIAFNFLFCDCLQSSSVRKQKRSIFKSHGWPSTLGLPTHSFFSKSPLKSVNLPADLLLVRVLCFPEPALAARRRRTKHYVLYTAVCPCWKILVLRCCISGGYTGFLSHVSHNIAFSGLSCFFLLLFFVFPKEHRLRLVLNRHYKRRSVSGVRVSTGLY